MRDKKLILTAVVILVVVLLVLGWVVFFPAPQAEPSPDGVESPFGDTSAERPFTPGDEVDPFAEMSPGWIQNTEGQSLTQTPLLRMVHSGPVLRPVIYTAEVGGVRVPTLRFAERKNGHIFDTPIEVVAPHTTVLEKTLQRLADAQWSMNGCATLYRYLDENNEIIFSYLGTFTVPTASTTSSSTPVDTTPTFSGRPLQNNVVSAAFSPDLRSLFYLVRGDEGVTGYLESLSSGTRTQVWSAPLRGLTVSWTTTDTIVIYTNPAPDAPGVVWLIDTKDWSEEVVLAREYTLEAVLSPNGEKLLYSFTEEESGVSTLRVMPLDTKEITYLPLPTLAEKCVWTQGDSRFVYCAVPRNMTTKNYLTLWQQGRLSSDDVLWRFDTTTGEAKMILDPIVEAKASFDMIDLTLDASGAFLAFRTKDREMLWAVRLPATQVVDSL